MTTQTSEITNHADSKEMVQRCIEAMKAAHAHYCENETKENYRAWIESRLSFEKANAELHAAEYWQAVEKHKPTDINLTETREIIGNLGAKLAKEKESAALAKSEWTDALRSSRGEKTDSIMEKMREQRYAEELADQYSEMLGEYAKREQACIIDASRTYNNLKGKHREALDAFFLAKLAEQLEKLWPLAELIATAESYGFFLDDKYGDDFIMTPADAEKSTRYKHFHFFFFGTLREMVKAATPAEIKELPRNPDIGNINPEEMIESPLRLSRAEKALKEQP